MEPSAIDTMMTPEHPSPSSPPPSPPAPLTPSASSSPSPKLASSPQVEAPLSPTSMAPATALPSPPMSPTQAKHIGFLALPLEIRLLVYHELLDPKTTEPLTIDSMKPDTFSSQEAPTRRSTYSILSGRHLQRTVETTYHLTKNPGFHPSILLANRQIHAEAAPVLYGANHFHLGNCVSASAAFLADLTPIARNAIRYVEIRRTEIMGRRDALQSAWTSLCGLLEGMRLRELRFGVEAGHANRWRPSDTYVRKDFETISRFDGMEWINQLRAIRGLSKLEVHAIWTKKDPPVLSFHEFSLNFAANVETGFAEFLREAMVGEGK